MARIVTIYKPEQIEFIRIYSKDHTCSQTLEICKEKYGYTCTVKNFRHAMIKRGIKFPHEECCGIPWSEEESDFLKDNIDGRTIYELSVMITEKFGTIRTPHAVQSRILLMGLHSGWKAPKGTVNGGSFVKGMIPQNTYSIGDICINAQSKEAYIKISDMRGTAENAIKKENYIMLKQAMWNVWNPDDPIKNGECVLAVDGNKYNFAKENLMKCTVEEMAYAKGKMNKKYGMLMGDRPEIRNALINIKKLENAIEVATNDE